ncbi:MAG: isochorismatase family cysteine hydrolase [bacterium]
MPDILSFAVRHYRWFPADNHLGRTITTVKVDPVQTAFLLVDPYLPPTTELSSKDYALWRGITLDHVAPALAAARRVNLPIIYAVNSAPRVALGRSAFAQKLSQSLDLDMERAFQEPIVDELEYRQGEREQLHFPDPVAPLPDDFYVRKSCYSGFYGTRLEILIRNLDIRHLICVGFRLDACLLGTVLDALYRNLEIILLRDCTLACELPQEIDDLAFTQRMILWFEALVGATADSEAFIAACAGLETKNKGGNEG